MTGAAFFFCLSDVRVENIIALENDHLLFGHRYVLNSS